jgi:hypothetical protein
MPTEPNRLEPSSWWLAPAAVVLLALVGLGVYGVPTDPPPDPPAVSTRTVPPPVPDDTAGLYAVSTGEEAGVRVVRIQAVPGGDELIVDAATGRLLEARPALRSPVPAGKPRLFAP